MQDKPLAEPRWIHFYLWRHLGRPIYIGQTTDVKRRNRARFSGREKSVLGKFIAVHLSECTLETLPDLAFDIPQGEAANDIENELMAIHDTMYPNGFNMGYELGKGPLNFASMGGTKMTELYVGTDEYKQWTREGGKNGAKRTHDLYPDKYPEWAKKGGYRTQELYPNIGRELGLKYGSKGGNKHVESGHLASLRTPEHQAVAGRAGANRLHELYPEKLLGWSKKGGSIGGHNRWHRDRGIVNPKCPLCRGVE